MLSQLIDNMLVNCNGHKDNLKEHIKKRGRSASTPRPVYLLSAKLMDTYTSINRKHARLIGNDSQRHDDEEYNYVFDKDETVGQNYFIQGQSLIGNGCFGKVYRVNNTITDEYVALKVAKSKRQFFAQAQQEIKILRHMERNDPHGEFRICYLLDSFVHRNHQCLVFGLLGFNLYELLKLRDFKVCV